MKKSNHHSLKNGSSSSSFDLTAADLEQVRQFDEAFRRLPTLAAAWLAERRGKISPAVASAVAAKICKSAQPDDKKIAIFSQFGPLGLWKELEKANTSPYTIVGRYWKEGLTAFLRLAEQQGLPRPSMRVIYSYADNQTFMDRWIALGGDINTKVDSKNLLTLFMEQTIQLSGVKIPELMTFARWFVARKGVLKIDSINNIYSAPLLCQLSLDKPGYRLSDWWCALNELGGDINKDIKIIDNIMAARQVLPLLKVAFEAGFSPNSPQFEKVDFLSAVWDEETVKATEEFIRQSRELALGNIANKTGDGHILPTATRQARKL